jgi:50S ribosomal subunit-associated GTPase HflX
MIIMKIVDINSRKFCALEPDRDKLFFDFCLKSLPHPNVEINALIPYDRGDLVSAVHERGEILSEEYVETGTQMRALVDGGLAKAIEDALL